MGSTDLTCEVDVMDGKLAELREHWNDPDYETGEMDERLLFAEQQWADVKKAAVWSVERIADLEQQLADEKLDHADDCETLDRVRVERDEAREESDNAEALVAEKQSEIDRLTDRYPQEHGTEAPDA